MNELREAVRAEAVELWRQLADPDTGDPELNDQSLRDSERLRQQILD